MKTERRHELQTNQLADSLGHWIEAARPDQRLITGVVIAVVVVVFSIVYSSAQSSQRLTKGWDEYFQAFNQATSTGDVGKLDDTAEKFAGTPVGFWSKLVAADIRLNEGTNQLFREKSEGRDQLNRAAESYEQVSKQARDPMLQQRALFGLARAHESLGDLKEAQAEYQDIVKRWPEGAYSQMAGRRASDLEKDSTRKFYDWFAKYEPPSMTRPGTPGQRPEFSHDSLISPNQDLKLPSVVDLLQPGEAGSTKKEEPAKEEPAKTEPTPESKSETKDAEKTPAAKPTETTPAAEEKKDKPAADEPAKPAAEPELKAPEKKPDTDS